MEAAFFMVIPALPVEEFRTPAYTTVFINPGSTMVFIIPEVFYGSSTQDLTMGALIRRFICGDFPKGFLAPAFTDSITTGFTRDSITTNFTMVFITENSPAGVITDFTANRLSSRTDRSHPQRSCHWIWLPMLSKSLLTVIQRAMHNHPIVTELIPTMIGELELRLKGSRVARKNEKEYN